MDAVRVERFYLGCLAHASYMIASEGLAVVIDPQRDVDIYIEMAERNGWRIAHIIETHLHADFVSGHSELAHRTGARIYVGAGSGAQFSHVPVKDGDEIYVGQYRLEFLQTPGHTLESVCVVATDLANPGNAKTVFTGDTLFLGDVGRPDLSATHTPQQLAELLYKSLHEKLLALPDDTVVYPAHGAGSLCGRQMSAGTSSTIGIQRQTNYALLAKSAAEFVQLLTEDMPPRPQYFEREVELNRRGAMALTELPELKALTAAQVVDLQKQGVMVVDTRPVMEFAVAHVPGAVHFALTGQYASWAARILGLDMRLIIVGEDLDHVRESQMRLARVGIENVIGYLEGGVAGWIDGGFELDYIPQITGAELVELRENETVALLDVRERGELAGGVIEGSMNIPLGQLSGCVEELDRQRLLVVHCAGGYRSSVATSLLRRAGFRDVANLIGGFDAWKAANLPFTVRAM